MSFKRMLLKNSFGGIGHLVNIAKNSIEEGSISAGVKKSIHEEICEDNLVTSYVYKKGKAEGKQDGYIEASEVYEQKLLDQADMFLQQKELFEVARDRYEELLDAYELEIEKLESKMHLTEEENEYLKLLLLKERQLRKLSK